MATNLIHFEVFLPNVDYNDSISTNAVSTFIAAMNVLTNNNCYQYQTNKGDTLVNYINFYGEVTTAQATTALSALSTLSTTIATPYRPVKCISWPVVTQP